MFCMWQRVKMLVGQPELIILMFYEFGIWGHGNLGKPAGIGLYGPAATGPKTIFFWAPAFKWGLVIGGLGDLNRPADKLSIPQVTSLAATGLVWCRYSLVIIPKNYSLFAVNATVAAINVYQLGRAIRSSMEKNK